MYQYQEVRGANGERFIVPFLFGALAGGAAVGVSRPRPVYVNQNPYYGPSPYYGGYPPYGAYGPYYRNY